MKSKAEQTLLVIGAPQHDASAYHLSGFLAPDPVICLRVAGKKYLVVSSMEYGRAEREARTDELLSFDEIGVMELARELKVPFISNQPQSSMLWRVIEDEVVPASEQAGISQIVWSPIAQGVLTGKYLPGQAPPQGSRATDAQGEWKIFQDFLSNPSDVDGIAAQLESAAAAAYSGQQQ